MALEPAWPSKRAETVAHLLPAARARLVLIAADAPMIEVAARLCDGIELLVACTSDGRVAGVLSKADVIAHLGAAWGIGFAGGSPPVPGDVVTCTAAEPLDAVWGRMRSHGLKNLPVDAEARPVGVLSAHDVLEVLLEETEEEESLLRAYVMGVGYR